MEVGQICIPNISPAERKKRLASGVVFLGISLAGLAALVVLEVPPGWRLALFPLYAAAAAGFFQWRDRT